MFCAELFCLFVHSAYKRNSRLSFYDLSRMFFVTPFPPRDQDDVELGYMGSRDFSLTEFQASLGRLQKLEFDLLLPGHYYFYGGAEAGRLIARAYEKARALKGDL